ncbi:PAS/PAC sensor hybrid histidine kinase [Stanieria cyanosphaera PCC 7437]|uniref:Circadian input-output histidine kinase CikA n=1 Tax=Stanieria cyanosphaera (strain ATCC 29371 / PCC 7437) TaxID=111780 RepID=K9XNK4_STAC7|nr:PAS domain S-box protein [Stanieria cyanosphaera]AFZ34098.1 PAS/PAC sensor hybrid histidine kinase [Stanieria cyanosphaera PCC 7437]
MKKQSIASNNPNTNFLFGGGEMGARIRAKDWSNTPLGSVEKWSQSLKTAVRIMLTSRQPMFVWWGKELINLYNDAYKSIVGGKHPEVLGQPASVVWREIWDQVGPRAESVMLNNEGTYDEALMLMMERNGYREETYYTFSYSPIPDDQGNTSGIICANTDDTQRIIGERQLALLRELAAKTADARTFDQACTLSSQCLETNPYDLPFAMIYLVNRDQQGAFLAGTCGIEPGHKIAPKTVNFDNNWLWSWEEVLKKNQSIVVSDLTTNFNNLPKGAWERSPNQVVVVPISPSGETGKIGILVVGLNPFRLFDDNYQRFIDLVSAQISASLANAQAYEEESKRAEALAELDRAKTTFFSNVSHEFRTPLTLMLSPLEETLTNCAILPPQERKQLEMVQRNGLRLLKLVNTLLDFSRIEAGRIEVSYEPTDLATLTTELTSLFRSAIERAKINLVVDCPALPEPIYVDREMWEKIVFNLLSNAFKFTFTGEIKVSLQWQHDRVELKVKDTGIGIPVAEIPHLFKRFHRVKGMQGRSFEGSGIGLSLVQELVRIHNGTIEVTSVVEEGSCFTVAIPTGKTHLPPNHICVSKASTSTVATSYLEEVLSWLPEEQREMGREGDKVKERFSSIRHLPSSQGTEFPSPARILLADDNNDMRDYLQRLLSQHYQVETVADGLAALSVARQNLPDLILTDVMMPELDGFELLRSLRNNPQTQSIPIILLSARAGEEARVEGLAAGADDYLIKPFSARELLARVDSTLKLAQLRKEANQREQKLRNEKEAVQQQLSDRLDKMTDAFVMLDRDWRIVYQNLAAERINQKPRSQVLGKTQWEEWSASVGTAIEHNYRQAMAEQVPVHFEHHYYAPPDYDLWLEIHAYPSEEGLSIFFRDISEQKRSQERVAEIEARFHTVADLVPDLLWRNDAQGVTQWCNRRWSEYTGQSSGDGQKSSWFDLIHPDQREYSLTNFQNAVNASLPFKHEYRIRGADGTYRWFLIRAEPLFDQDGQILQWFGAATDIHQQRTALEALRDREAFISAINNTAKVVIVLYDLVTDKVVYVNNYVEQVLGFSVAEFYAISSEEAQVLIHPEDLEATMNFVKRSRVAKDGENLLHEYRLRHKNGQYRWFQASNAVFERQSNHTAKSLLNVLEDITERKQAEQALRESEARFQTLVKNMPGMVYRYQPENNTFTYVSCGSLKLLAVEPELILQNAEFFWRTIHPDDLQSLKDSVLMAVQQSQPWQWEGRIITNSGQLKWIQGISSPEETTAGKVWDGILIDISERKQAEAALRSSEERFRQMAETIDDVFWINDPHKSQILYVSPAYDKVWGRSRDEIYQNLSTWFETIHPDDREQVQTVSANSKRHNGEQIEYRIVRPDGSIRWILDRGFAVRDAKGKVERVIGVAQDITTRKQAESALHQSQVQLQQQLAEIEAIYATAPIGLAIFDTNLRFARVNERLTEMNGYSVEAHFGKTIRELLPDLADASEQILRSILETGEPKLNVEIRGKTPAQPGVERIWLEHFLPLKNGEDIIGINVVCEEITFRKQAEIELEQILQREQAAREEAERANRIKDEFLAVLSHELRSPLNPILGWSKLLQTQKFDQDTTNRALETIERNAKIQVQLIEDLLDISRIIRGKLSLTVYPVSLVSIIEAAIETVNLSAQAKSIAIKTKFEPGVGQVSGDPSRLQQVVWNLLSNAVKFTPEGGQIEVKLKSIGFQAQISVKDTGRGISPDFLPHVFDYFRQEDSATTRRFGGLGLGLAIVRHLVELHGGTVAAKSLGEGQGATFMVRLPLLKDQNKSKDQEKLTPSLSSSCLQGIRILAVDDDADIRDLVEFILQQAGAKVKIATSATEAFQEFKDFVPDLLICDIGMPEIDGYMLMRQIRKLPSEQGGKIKAIALTAYAAEIDQQQVLAAGFDLHLAKPVEPEKLLDAIAALTKQNEEKNH